MPFRIELEQLDNSSCHAVWMLSHIHGSAITSKNVFGQFTKPVYGYAFEPQAICGI